MTHISYQINHKKFFDRKGMTSAEIAGKFMKIFNEIESEVSGTIKKILIEDSNPVEYGQAIISVEIND